MRLGNVQKPAAKRRGQPLVAAGGIVITAQLRDIQCDLRRRVGTIHADGHAPLSSGRADGIHGQDQCRRRRNVTDDQQASTFIHFGQDRLHDLLLRLEAFRQPRDDRRRRSSPLAGPLPDAFHGAIFVVGQYHLVTFLKCHIIGNQVHPRCSILDENKAVGMSADEAGQCLPGGQPGRLVPAEEEIHRLAVDLLQPIATRCAHRIGRRPERTVVQVGCIVTQVPQRLERAPRVRIVKRRYVHYGVSVKVVNR